MESLIKLSVALALSATLFGNLQQVLKAVRKAQFALIQKSQGSKWPKVWIPKSTKR